MSNYPWIKFYPNDWRSDTRLRMCSPAARGVWIDMLCIMHEATPYGHLAIDGEAPTKRELAVLLSVSIDELTPLIEELERYKVFSRRNNGVIYSRKMVNAAQLSEKRRIAGSKGGNPELKKSAGDNDQGEPSAPSSPPKPPKPPKPEPVSGKAPFNEFWLAWPNKVKKKDAEKAWAKLSEEDRRAAIGRLKSWWDIWRKTYPRASPIHPSTYLNGQRWRDEFNGASAQMDPDIARWANMK